MGCSRAAPFGATLCLEGAVPELVGWFWECLAGIERAEQQRGPFWVFLSLDLGRILTSETPFSNSRL